MDTFLYTVKYRNVDQTHTKFMTVILFKEGEREWGQERENGGLFILNLLFLKKTKFYLLN